MKALNATAKAELILTEDSRVNETFIYKVNKVATDISGGAFKWDLLDKEGGTVIDSLTVSYTTDGTDGSVSYIFEISELAVILASFDDDTGELPAFHQFFFSSDGTAEKYKVWFDGPVKVKRSG